MRSLIVPLSNGEMHQSSSFASLKMEEWLSFETMLSPEERKIADGFASDKRRREFCSGRIATKLAIAEIDKNVDLSDICVDRGDAGVPILRYAGYSVSISHSHGVAAAFVFGDYLSFGIDIEQVRPHALKTMRRVVDCAGESVPEDAESLTMAWCLKESLSKCLKTGFSVPISHFVISNFKLQSNQAVCDFSRYPAYTGKAVRHGDDVFAIVGYREYISNIAVENFV